MPDLSLRADGCHGDCRGKEAGLSHLRRGSGAARESGCPVLEAAVRHVRHPAFSYVFAGGLDLDPAKTEEILTEACEKARSCRRTSEKEAAAVRGRLPAALALVLLLSACGGPPLHPGADRIQ